MKDNIINQDNFVNLFRKEVITDETDDACKKLAEKAKPAIMLSLKEKLDLEADIRRSFEIASNSETEKLPKLAGILNRLEKRLLEIIPEPQFKNLCEWLEKSRTRIKDYDGSKLLLPLIRFANIKVSSLTNLFPVSPTELTAGLDPCGVFYDTPARIDSHDKQDSEHICISILKTELITTDDEHLVDC
jgi:hypothetical protein